MNRSTGNKPPESLLKLQQRFAGHIRNPEEVPAPPGVEDRRMAIYRRLFFGNLSNLMAKNFPVLRRLVEDGCWDEVIRAFMTGHRARTPMFTEIGREFVEFLQTSPPDALPPFAVELAHWEYLETRVRLHEADPGAMTVEADGDLLASPPVLNPTVQMAAYHWPVHEIGPECQPDRPLDSPIVLAAFRLPGHRVRFLRLNRLTARLLELVATNPERSGRDQLAAIADEIGSDNPEGVVRSGAGMLQRLHDQGLVLGTVPPRSHPDQ